MKIIGLTGGIACGKSTVTAVLSEEDVPILDCDLIARQVVEPGKPALKQIVNAFSDVPDLLLDDGSLNRKALGKIVFADEQRRKTLQSITGKAISYELFKKVAWHWLVGSPVVVIDAPTLYETKYLVKFCSKIIVVALSPETQLKRLMARDNSTEQEAMNRIKSQMPIEEKVKLADIVIWNEETKEELREKSRQLARDLEAEGRGLSLFFSGPGIILLASAIMLGLRLSRS